MKQSLIFLIVFIFFGCSETNAQIKNDSLFPNNQGVYLLLFRENNWITDLAKLVGKPGNFWHVELVYNGYAYGCRPPKCEKISTEELRKRFSGHHVQIRELDEFVSIDSGIALFMEERNNAQFDVFYNNCTDAIWFMGGRFANGHISGFTRPIVLEWTNVETAVENPKVRNYLTQNKIPIPHRKEILFPDEFEKLGEFVGETQL